jgi:hypothetical protein
MSKKLYNSYKEYIESTRKSKETYWNEYTARLSSVVDTTRTHTIQYMTSDLEILATTLYHAVDSRENNPNLFTESDIRQNILVFRQTLDELNDYIDRLEESSCDSNVYINHYYAQKNIV